MEIGAVGLQPFIYNTNQVNAASMNRVRPVPSDVNAEKTDYSGLVGNNENRLRPGESANFADIIDEQMSRAQQNATRIMRSEERPNTEVIPPAPEVSPAQATSDNAAEASAVQVTPYENGVDAGSVAAETVVRPETEAVIRPEAETREPVQNIAASSEQTANAQNAGAVTAMVTEDGAVTAFSREPMVGNPVEDFRLEAPVTGNSLTGGTVFNNVIPDALDVPYTNAAVDYAEAHAGEPTLADRMSEANANQANDPVNIFQMQRATNAYALAMGF